MVRPPGDVPATLHGAMRELSEMYDISLGEAYVLAAKVLINLESDLDYNPSGDELLETFLERTPASDDESDSDS